MEESNHRVADCGCRKPSDRYTSFDGIDCDLNARRVMAFIERNMAASEGDQPFWTYFMGKRTPRSGPVPDDLFWCIRTSTRFVNSSRSAATPQRSNC